MHEASLVASVLEICETTARQHGATAVVRVRLRVGAFTGVVREALEFAFEALRSGTIAEKAALEIIPEPLAARCPQCGEVDLSPGDLCLFCVRCGSVLEVTAGRELLVESIDLE